MTNAEVIQTMTVKELANLMEYIHRSTIWASMRADSYEDWLRADCQAYDGLLSDMMKPYWKVH